MAGSSLEEAEVACAGGGGGNRNRRATLVESAGAGPQDEGEDAEPEPGPLRPRNQVGFTERWDKLVESPAALGLAWASTH